MRYPRLNPKRTNTVTVPELTGGTNFRDSVTMIGDNQLTDSLNVWFKDGILKTRPGLENNDIFHGIPLYNSSLKTRATDIYVQHNKKTYRLIEYSVNGKQNGTYGSLGSETGLIWVSDDDIVVLPSLNAGIQFTVKHKNKIYAFCSDKKIYSMEIDFYAENPKWSELSTEPGDEEHIYIPTVMTHCKSAGTLVDTVDEIKEQGGIMLEGYNLLSPYYKMVYSTFNRGIARKTSDTDSTLKHTMMYGLFGSVNKKEFAGKKVTVTILSASGTKYVHEVTLTGDTNWVTETVNRGDNRYLAVHGSKFYFLTGPTVDSSIDSVTENEYVEDNMEIIAPCSNSTQNLDKVFGMTESTWFGGDSAGISGGTRLFLGGNENSDEKSLMLWSGLNNPLCFFENNYAYVGDGSQSITAFGRQNDSLIIFKERETFYTQYTRNSGITAEELISQSVIDYTASSVYFPIIQLHSAIGCDSPRTVQLCRNFLVWSYGKEVYTLRAQNQFSERNIYKISDMVSRRLQACGFKNAFSADWNGHYLLFTDNKAFVMDYESYGYIYVNSYNKSEDAQIKIPWWQWDFPMEKNNMPYTEDSAELFGMHSAFILNNELITVFYRTSNMTRAGNGLYFYLINNTEGYDIDDIPIVSSLTTKIFDFNSPHTNKNVPLINIAFGNNNGIPIEASFVTESGTEEWGEVCISESESNEYEPDYVHNRQFRPMVRLINRIGIRLKCEGKMAIDSISLNYKILGGSK